MKGVASSLLAVTLILGAQPAIAVDKGPAAAVVNGVRIEPWEAERELQILLPQTSFHRRLEGERRTEIEGQALDALVMKELKRQWAERDGLSVDTSIVDRELTEIRQRFPDEAAYRQALVESGASNTGLRNAIERDHLAKAIDERITVAVPEPTADEVARFFAANRADYVTPESRHVIHVLVYVAASAGAAVWESAEAEAAVLAVSARGGTLNFLEEAARRRSDIPPRYRDQTGDLGMIHRGALQADVDQAVFSGIPNEVIGPVRTIYGYSVLQVLSIEPPRELELTQVRDAVYSRIRSEGKKTALADFESSLLTAATIDREVLSAEQ